MSEEGQALSLTDDYYKIVAPVNPQELYSYFGVVPGSEGYDVGLICSNSYGKINPASKVKPVRRGTPFPLSEESPSSPDGFKGTVSDNYDGVYYGLKCRYVQRGDVSWGDMHGCNWEYLPPRPGIDWSRLTDFDGYNHTCVFNPRGGIYGVSYPGTLTLYYDRPENLTCTVNCATVGDRFQDGTIDRDENGRPINPDYVGVNLQDIAGEVNPGEDPDLGSWYPCILISDLNESGEPTSPHMVRALASRSASDLTQRYQPLRNSSGAWQGQYTAETYIELNGNEMMSSSSFPRPTGPCRKIATLFITDRVYGAGVTDLTRWQDVSNMIVSQSRMFTVPLGAGIILDYKRQYAQGITFKGANAYTQAGLVWFRCLFDWVKELPDNFPDPSATYTVSASLNSRRDGLDILVSSDSMSIKYVEGMISIIQLELKSNVLVGTGSGPITFVCRWRVTSDKTGDHVLNEGEEEVEYNP